MKQKNITYPIAYHVTAALIGLSLGQGCAPGHMPATGPAELEQTAQTKTAYIDSAKRLLGVRTTDLLVFLPGGYITSDSVADTLSTIAAIESGNAELSVGGMEACLYG